MSWPASGPILLILAGCTPGEPGIDADGDGYTTDRDCDDEDIDVFPGAWEICGDGVVNDCNGEPASAQIACGLGGEVDLTELGFRLNGVEEDGEAGGAVAGLGDVNGDGLADLLIGAPAVELDDGQGVVYLVLGGGGLASGSGKLSLKNADRSIEGDMPDNEVGAYIAGAGDVDGDGYDDVLLNDISGGYSWTSYLLFGGGDWMVAPTVLSLADSDLRLIPPGDERWGGAVAGAGDLDGDGLDDLLVGEPAYNALHGSTDGAILLIPGGALADRASGDRRVDAVGRRLAAEQNTREVGYVLASAGDVDGDGLADVLVGSSDENGGRAYVVLGDGLDWGVSIGDLQDADARVASDDRYQGAGHCVASAGDTDGDGLDDVLVGSDSAQDSGIAWLLLGRSLSAGLPPSQLDEADLILEGSGRNAMAGYAVASAGDVDADGLADLLIGAYEANGGGTAYLLFGGPTRALSGTVSLADADAALVTGTVGDETGRALAGAGDVDADGFDDLLIGAPDEDGHGVVWLVHGGGY